ncbi:MAG TPA: hypothetical protein VNO81_12930 [Candidatus Nitrosotenuis sp.]|jgi:photosystem II stability/assembly factor-like uncharacterized protein|nr:hypothetical protein [Candidatus Nitrosotenuis sp.]
MELILALGTDRGAVLLRPGTDETGWKLAAAGMQARQIVCLAADPSGRLYAGAANGAVYRTLDGEKWDSLVEGLTHTSVHALSLHPAHPQTIFAGTQPATVYRSDDGGATWRVLPSFMEVPGVKSWTLPYAPYRALVRCLAHHPMQPDVVFAAVMVGGVLATLDGGKTWSERQEGIPREVRWLALHPGAPARLCAATSGGFYRSDDLGGRWVQKIHGLPYPNVMCLAIDPADPNRLLAGVNRSREGGGAAVCRSADGGERWEVVASGLPSLTDQVLTAMTFAPGQCFLGTDKGMLFASDNFGSSWRKLRGDLPPIRALLAYVRP